MGNTKYDVLFALFAIKSAKLGEIARQAKVSPSSARQKLAPFEKDGVILREKGVYSPNKGNQRTWLIFDIMKFSRERGINYNFLLSPQMAKVLAIGLGKEEVHFPNFRKLNYTTTRKYLTCLSRLNLLFVVSKRPLRMKFVREPVLEKIVELFGAGKKEKKERQQVPSTARCQELENLLKQYKKLAKDLPLLGQEEEQKLEFTSASTQLEGNTFTLEQTKDLINKDLVPADKKMREALEVKNYYAAVNSLFSRSQEPLSVQSILELHRTLISNLGQEGLRTVNVSIQGNPAYKTAHFSQILPKLDKLCGQINEFNAKKHTLGEAVEFATYVHNEFQHIHPFEDGNSRTTRLLWNYVLLRHGFPLINIYANTRAEYLSLTKLARERDDARLNAFLTRIIIDNLHKLLRLPSSEEK